MKLLVTLYKMTQMSTLSMTKICGFIFGGPFSLNYSYSLEEIKEIKEFCDNNGLESYINIDTFIHENNLNDLNEYLSFIRELDVNGIYYHDFAVYNTGVDFGLKDKMIYDGQTMVCNGLDATFYSEIGGGVVLSRELVLNEYQNILKRLDGKGDMQIFGHLRMSYSRRKFLSNYFKVLGKEYDVNKKTFTMTEEQRDYKMPIVEDDYGTRIYTDYVFAMFKEFVMLKEYIGHGLIDGLFLSDEVLFDFARLYSELNENNYDGLKKMLENKYSTIDFSDGYLYLKTNKVKE